MIRLALLMSVTATLFCGSAHAANESLETVTVTASREQMRQARNEAIRLLVAEPFEEATYERQLIKVDELRRQRTKRMSDEMKELVKGLPPEQRSAVGEMLKRPGPPA